MRFDGQLGQLDAMSNIAKEHAGLKNTGVNHGVALGNGEVHSGITRKFVLVSDEPCCDVAPVVAQMPGDHEPVAAVVARPTKNEERLLFRISLQQELGGPTARVLHEHDAGNAKLFNGS